MEGEGGGEAVGVGEVVVGLKFGGDAREFQIGGNKGNGELSDSRDEVPRKPRALIAPDGVIEFAPVDDGHEEVAFAVGSKLQEALDFVGAGPIEKVRQQGAGIENHALHSFRSRRRSW